MKIKMHDNGWAVIIEDFNIVDATIDQVKEIAKLIGTNICVIIKKQFVTVEEEINFIRMFKDPRPVFKGVDDEASIHMDVPGTDGIVSRVTGEKNTYGVPGIAGHPEEMLWHNNFPWRSDRLPIVYLRGVRGTAGSRTSWTNFILAYNDMTEEMKSRVENIVLEKLACTCYDCEQGTVRGVCVGDNFQPKLVHTNQAGKKGLFLPHLHIKKIQGMTELETQDFLKPIVEYALQEKYCYHHDWEDGDIVISEQWLSEHKRWAFDKIEQRLLHRAAMDYPDGCFV